MKKAASASASLTALDDLLRESPEAAKARRASAFDQLVDGRRLVLFGAGNRGRESLAELRRHGVEPVCFADSFLAEQVTTLDGLDVLRPADAAQRFGRECAFVITILNPYTSVTEVETTLRQAGCDIVVPLILLAWKYPAPFFPYYGLDLPEKILEHGSQVRSAFQLLGDDDSRHEYLGQIRWRLTGDYDDLPPASTTPPYFEDQLLRLRSDEVFVDCGAFDGDSVRSFLEHSQDRFDKVIALEPDPGTFAQLKAWITTLPEATRGRITPLPAASGAERRVVRFAATGQPAACISETGGVNVECYTLDELLRDERPTYIKMDIEGSEPDTLRGAAQTLRRDSPALAVCVYHQQDHLWQIPLQIQSLLDGYRFHLRRYCHHFWEEVLYAIPAERLPG